MGPLPSYRGLYIPDQDESTSLRGYPYVLPQMYLGNYIKVHCFAPSYKPFSAVSDLKIMAGFYSPIPLQHALVILVRACNGL